MRVSEMRRRPRAREAAEDEDDNSSGTWVIRADEPQESVEDPCGLQRPTDRDDAADPEGLADSLWSCPRLAWCAPPDRRGRCFAVEKRSTGPKVPALVPVQPHGIVYPEWDYRLKGYRSQGAIVQASRRLRSATPRG